MRSVPLWSWLLAGLLLVLVHLTATGCKSPESENVSARPWNAPQGYDANIPGLDTYRGR